MYVNKQPVDAVSTEKMQLGSMLRETSLYAPGNYYILLARMVVAGTSKALHCSKMLQKLLQLCQLYCQTHCIFLSPSNQTAILYWFAFYQ